MDVVSLTDFSPSPSLSHNFRSVFIFSVVYWAYKVCMFYGFLIIVDISMLFSRSLDTRFYLGLQVVSYSVIFSRKQCIFCHVRRVQIKTGQTGLLEYKHRNFEGGNWLNLTATAVVGQHLWVTVHCYPLTLKFLQCCLLRDFDGKQFHCKMLCGLEVTNENARCWEKISNSITIVLVVGVICTLLSEVEINKL